MSEDAGLAQLPGPKTANDTLIEHAERLWLSECENASRIAGKIQLIAGASLGLLGASTFGSEWFYYLPSAPICPKYITLAIHLLLATVIVLLGFTLAALYARKTIRPTANREMELDDSDVGLPTKTIVFKKTYRAYLNLRERNAAERIRLKKGEEWFSAAIVLTFLAILLYIFGSLGAKMSPRQSDVRSTIQPTTV